MGVERFAEMQRKVNLCADGHSDSLSLSLSVSLEIAPSLMPKICVDSPAEILCVALSLHGFLVEILRIAGVDERDGRGHAMLTCIDEEEIESTDSLF